MALLFAIERSNGGISDPFAHLQRSAYLDLSATFLPSPWESSVGAAKMAGQIGRSAISQILY